MLLLPNESNRPMGMAAADDTKLERTAQRPGWTVTGRTHSSGSGKRLM